MRKPEFLNPRENPLASEAGDDGAALAASCGRGSFIPLIPGDAETEPRPQEAADAEFFRSLSASGLPKYLELIDWRSGNPVEVDDSALLDHALSGDENAFTALYRLRHPPVYRFALQMTGSVVIAEDVTQEVFMALLENGRRFDPARGTLASFLYGIARNLVLRRIERERKTEAVADFAGDDDVLGDLTRRETIEQVRRAVLSLPAMYREAIVMCDLQDLSYEDAAAALDCPVGTVRSRLNRGRAMLAKKLRFAASAGCGL